MDLLLSDEQLKFKDNCRRFAAEKLIPISEKYGETDDIPQEMVKAMAEAGFFRLFLPAELGGNDIKVTPICLAREQIAGVYCPADVTLAMQGLGSYPICMAGNQSQKEKDTKVMLVVGVAFTLIIVPFYIWLFFNYM